MSKAETPASDRLVLPPRLDAAAATVIWRSLGSRLPRVIDFVEVRDIDSSALALVFELKKAAGTTGGLILENVPERFARLCAAHRVEQELLG